MMYTSVHFIRQCRDYIVIDNRSIAKGIQRSTDACKETAAILALFVYIMIRILVS